MGFISKQQKKSLRSAIVPAVTAGTAKQNTKNHYKIKMKVSLHWFPLGKKMSFINPGGWWIKQEHPLL